MDKVSYFVVDNLHCPSCIFTVKSTLNDELGIPATNVHVSLINQTVTVRHNESITPLVIVHALEKVGFEVELDNNTTEDDDHQKHSSWNPLASRKRRRRHREVCKSCQADHRAKQEKKTLFSRPSLSKSVGSLRSGVTSERTATPTKRLKSTGDVTTELAISGMTCASCANAITDGIKEYRTRGILSCDVNVMGNAARVVHDSAKISAEEVASLIEQFGYGAEVITSRPVTRRQRVTSQDFAEEYRLEFHIGGMTCASCSNTVTHGLQAEPYIKSVNVNLMANSGTVILSSKEDAQKVKEAVEAMGFICDLGEIAPLRMLDSAANDVRIVRIRIDGMFCTSCPENVIETLQSIRGIIDFTPISLEDPVVVVRYKPKPPDVTLRTIFSALRSDRLTPSIEKRATIEERSRRLQARERRHILWRIIAAVIIAIPTFVIGIVYMALVPHGSPGNLYWETPIWGNASRDVVALFFLATPVQFFIADHFHRKALKGLYSLWRKGSRVPVWKRFVRFGSMDLLISLGTSVAYFSSLALLIISATSSSITMSYSTTFFDTTVFLTMFILLGRYLEAYTKGKAADAVSMLAGLRPTEAILDTIGSEDERVSTDLLEVGDIVKVPNGSTPPGDGTIISGSSKFDESSLTGESRPAHKDVGDTVYVGTMNVGGVVTVKLDAIGGSSMLDKIVDIVRQGQSNRAPIERFADTLTGYFVPVIVLLAVLTWVIWLSLGESGSLPLSYLDVNEGGWVIWSLQFAIAVFVIACPCGIGLAAPTACYVGSGLAAKHGILVQGGGEAFQEASLVDCVVFDKTGTLTMGGDPKVTESEIFAEDREKTLAIANEMESASTHTLALAVRNFCEPSTSSSKFDVVTEQMEETGGRGIYAEMRVDKQLISAIIGNEEWMEEHDALYPSNSSALLDRWKSQGKSVVIMATRTTPESEKAPEALFKVVAQFAVSDPLRKEAPLVIKELEKQGIATWMISGDNVITAQAVAAMVGIREDHVIAGVLPHQKAEKAQWLQKTAPKRQNRHWWNFKRNSIASPELQGSGKGRRAIVAMVGDGINDAPALAVSDLGIAVGSGSDIALGSSKFILLSSNLLTLLTLFDLSATVFRRIKFNFGWAIVYNMIGVPLAAGVIYPAGVRLDASWAALLMALSSVSVVLSSLHLKLYKQPKSLRQFAAETQVSSIR